MITGTCTPRTTKCTAKDHLDTARDNAIWKLNILCNSPIPGDKEEKFISSN
jgi:hypothetical protein